MMAQIQQASFGFVAPVAAAYSAACVSWLVIAERNRRWWPAATTVRSDRPRTDLLLGLAAAAAILLLGAAYRRGYLLPGHGGLAWTINNLIIYCPILVVLVARRQPADSVFLHLRGLCRKLAFGAAMGILSVTLFAGLRGEIAGVPGILLDAVNGRRLVNFLPVFLEGVALAFLFVRLRWALGLAAALAIPSILFAVAHVPGQLESHLSLRSMAAFFVLNSVLPAFILYVVQRSQDVIWIGIVHYLMDVAIGAV